jgi:hypothetical protein
VNATTPARIARTIALPAACAVALLVGCSDGTLADDAEVRARSPARDEAPVQDQRAAVEAPRRAVNERWSVEARAYMEPLERDLLDELNLLRADPRAYTRYMESMLGWYDGKLMRRPGGLPPIKTIEGEPALREAIAAVKAMRGMGPLRPSKNLTFAAEDHVKDQGPTGDIGHRGTDGSNSYRRMTRYGTSHGLSGEVIGYGWTDARDIVIDLLIDDGIADRGHRVNVLDPTYRLAGVSCGQHKVYGIMCVVDMAESYTEKGGAEIASRVR